MGHIFDNNLVLCGRIFFIHVPNKLYFYSLTADILYVDLYGIL